MNDYLQQFRQTIEAAGLMPPAEMIDDGKLHRFSSNGKRGDDSGWYVLHGDGVPSGAFGCWRSGLESKWCAKSEHDLSATERNAMREHIRTALRQREAERVQRHAEAKNAAAALLAKSEPATTHAYLSAKGIKAHGTRQDGGRLLVPMRDTDGVLHSVQTIEADGSKRFLLGGRAKGCYFSIGKPDGGLIVCEGFATGASIHEATGRAVAVAFNADNMEAVTLALRAKYPALAITLAADDDHLTTGNPGVFHAKAAALAVGGMMALPVFPADRADKATDFNDLQQLAGADAVRRCFEAAQIPTAAILETKAWPRPEPLSAHYEALPYPLDALPQTIRAAVQEVLGFVKAPAVLAASSALSAVSVAIQGFYDVERAPGLKGPSALYLLSIAESGERKTTCDGYFKQALERWQTEQAELLKPAVEIYRADKAAWDAKKSGVLEAIKKSSKDGKPTDEHQQALRDLEHEEPLPIRVPQVIRGDDTPENLGWALMREWPSAGVLSSEAGTVFGGHAMGSDSVTRNLALLNTLWDGGAIRVGRRTSDSYTIDRVRLSMGLQVQEATLRASFDKTRGLMRGTGFLARFLVAWPESTMGTRLYTEAPDWSKLQAFNARMTELLQNPLSIDEDGRLTTTTLVLSPSAHVAWVQFQNAIEKQLGQDGELQDVKDVASKTADNAARLATLFHVFEHGAGAISVEAMARGAKLAAWHLSEARRFLGQFALPVEWLRAERLERWLIQYCRREQVSTVPTKTAMQYGPLRDKAALQSALEALEDHGRARPLADGRKRLIMLNPALLEVQP
jgi:putative DNA primase/helicase